MKHNEKLDRVQYQETKLREEIYKFLHSIAYPEVSKTGEGLLGIACIDKDRAKLLEIEGNQIQQRIQEIKLKG